MTANAKSSILKADDIKKSYKTRQVVKGVSLQIAAGESVGLLGPNGAGKTTTFYMIVGLVRPNSGSIQLDGEDITKLPMHARARLGVGYLPQEASVFRKLSVKDNIYAILESRKDLSRAKRESKLEELLEELHITHIRDSLGISLSGGERRRVEIARALAADPLFILLDEPFAGVDPIAVAEMQQIIAKLRDRQMGILITDHNFRETLAITDRAYVMRDGQILASGNAEELYSNPLVKQYYLGDNFQQ